MQQSLDNNDSGRKDIVVTSMVVSEQGEAILSFSVIDAPRGKCAGCISGLPYFLPVRAPFAPLEGDCVIVRRRLRSPNRGDEEVKNWQRADRLAFFTLLSPWLWCKIQHCEITNVVMGPVYFVDYLERLCVFLGESCMTLHRYMQPDIKHKNAMKTNSTRMTRLTSCMAQRFTSRPSMA